jgi:hypothetical protein
MYQSQSAANMAKAARLQSQSQRDAQRARLDEIKTMLNVLVEQSKLHLEKSRSAADIIQTGVDQHLQQQKLRTDLAKAGIQAQAQRDVARMKPPPQGGGEGGQNGPGL